MLGLLPLLALAASIYAFSQGDSDFRTGLFRGAVAWGVALVAITEALSVFELINVVSVSVSWVVFCGIALSSASRAKRSEPGLRGDAGSYRLDSPGANDQLVRAQLIAIAAIALTAFVLALLAAPATADSMTYHLPRVEHWIQNRSVAPYHSNIERELWPGPGAEYILMHVELLSRSDRGVTLVQWFAYALNVVVAGLLAGELRGTRRAQAFAAFLAATIPGAVAQATGAQVELVFSFWLGCSVFFGLRLGKVGRDGSWFWHAGAFGAAIGIAVFTKATAYVFFAPFAIWFFVATVRRIGGRAIPVWLVAGAIALAINGPHYYRNSVLYGNPLSKPGANGVVNSSFFLGGTISNVVRNISLHFGTPFGAVNGEAESAINALDASLGVAPDDKRTTFPGERYHFPSNQSAEQTAGSPAQVVLALFALGFLTVAGRTRYRTQLEYMVCIAGGFLLFCFYLRWQPWHARLHVPLLMLAAPVCGIVVDIAAKRWLLWAITGVAFLTALPPLLRNPARPLIAAQPIFTVPRQRQYFAEHPDLYDRYVAATDHLKALGCHDLGLWVRGDAAEYPLWTLMRTDGRESIRIRHISIGNQSASLARTPSGDNFKPCALMYVASDGRAIPLVVPTGYAVTWQLGDIKILTPSDSP